MSEIKELKEKLLYKRKSAFDAMDEKTTEEMNEYAKGYMEFLDNGKTERECVNHTIKLVSAKGYIEYKLGDKLVPGGKYYYNNRGKAIYVFRIGSESVENGVRISASHIDSPRLDLKPNPLFEDSGIGYFKTHYYGGVKKYQWLATPLAIHGTIIRKDGTSVDIVVGENDSDPVFYISDLLPHLAKDQMARSGREIIAGEKLNVIIGSVPYKGADSDKVKLNIMKYLNDEYGIIEEDFISAEIEIVPAFKAREIGFDRSFIGAYGHDDRVCSYPAITALLESEESAHTVMAILADKEEVGSGGNTGMKSGIFIDIIDEIAKAFGADVNIVKANSKCLSADVNAAYDPNFAEVYERNNASFANGGVVLTKYTGSGGKGSTNDCGAEFVAFVRQIFDKENIVWQTGELGKVDQGGGGTVAVYIAEKNIDVVDLGVPVLSMHAPWEAIAKTDLLMTHKAFKAFNIL